MNSVYVLAPRENWVVDRFVEEWNADNTDITSKTAWNAQVIWLLANWVWNQVPYDLLAKRKVITTVHHIVPEKFGNVEKLDFERCDKITTVYHVYNQRTHDFIRPLTKKPIELIHYWANQKIWKPTDTKENLRKKHSISNDAFLVGSFQRDTEGAGYLLKEKKYLPKHEKGPDLFVDAIKILVQEKPNLHVLLSGWRRDYLMERLTKINVPFTLIERPSQSVINELYQTLDLYVVSARHEGGPQALIECGLTNVPVISTPVGIAEQVLPQTAINDRLELAKPSVPTIDESWLLPRGYEGYRNLIGSL